MFYIINEILHRAITLIYFMIFMAIFFKEKLIESKGLDMKYVDLFSLILRILRY